MSTTYFRQMFQPASRISFRLRSVASLSMRNASPYSTTARKMAVQDNSASQVISETAKAEGGPSKGSTAAEMQSQVGKTRNFEEAVNKVGNLMENDPAAVTSKVSTPSMFGTGAIVLTYIRTLHTSNLAKLVQPVKHNRLPIPSVPKPSDLPRKTKVQLSPTQHLLTHPNNLRSTAKTTSRRWLRRSKQIWQPNRRVSLKRKQN